MKNKLHDTIYLIGDIIISFMFIGFIIYMSYYMSVNSLYVYIRFVSICIAVIFDVWIIRKYKKLYY